MSFRSIRYQNVKGSSLYPPPKSVSKPKTQRGAKMEDAEKHRTGDRRIYEEQYFGLQLEIKTVPRPKNYE